MARLHPYQWEKAHGLKPEAQAEGNHFFETRHAFPRLAPRASRSFVPLSTGSRAASRALRNASLGLAAGVSRFFSALKMTQNPCRTPLPIRAAAPRFTMSMFSLLLPLALAVVACLYAAVGHAGATGYIAVMGLFGIDPQMIRPTALSLNAVVGTIATVQFTRAGHLRRQLLLPLAMASVPAAAIGGWLRLPTAVFEGLVGVVLLLSAIQNFWHSAGPEPPARPRRVLPAAALTVLGGLLGLLSGLTGVGGGVFLTPALLALNAAQVKQVAAVSAPFILVNSLAGLAGWSIAGNGLPAIGLPLVVAVIIGGLIGSQLGAFRLPPRGLRLLMAVVLLVAGFKLLARGVAG